MNARRLIEAFTTWTQDGEPLVLARVFNTQGSTYSKAGECMLLTADGRFQGMLSGGCLEGDLAERAKQVIESGQSQTATYDLGKDDELWGLGVGCDGIMHILLQPLSVADGYQPFASIIAALRGTSQVVCATVVESGMPELALGTTVLIDQQASALKTLPGELARQVEGSITEIRRSGQSALVSYEQDGTTAKLLLATLRPSPRLLLLGAGLDAVPLVNMARELGWTVEVADHRPANFSGGRFANADVCHCDSVQALIETIAFSQFDAIVVMSHHLETDRKFLAAIASATTPYVGLLGPRARRDRLLAALGAKGANLSERLHGPAGLDIGARGPEGIALSILAEIQRELA